MLCSDTCKTFGSGVVQPFNGSSFYVRSNCPFTLTRFTHNRVECDITTRRGDSGLLVQVEIIINKIRTVLQNGSILVEKKRFGPPNLPSSCFIVNEKKLQGHTKLNDNPKVGSDISYTDSIFVEIKD